MNFTFNYAEWKRVSSTQSEPIVYVAPASRERIKEALERGCDCQHDGQRTASLVRRNGAAWLQCDACGSALGNAMRRDDHPKILQYPGWRNDLVDAYAAARQAYHKVMTPPAPTQEERIRAYQERSVEYEAWCRSSPEWRQIKERILWRSRRHCEACLGAPAAVVHHLTYEFGKIPPAWHLKAVCSECHTRMHTAGDDWCEFGMARGE